MTSPASTPAFDGVFVIGEALVDIVESDAGAVAHPGGGPANVALGLARQGVPTRLLAWIGTDPSGELIAEHLTGSGVALDPASFGAARTPTATARIRPDGSASYAFDIEWDVPPVTAPDALAVHTGSIAAFLSPGAAKVRAMLASSTAPLISFDPNIRPALVPPHAESLAICEQLLALAHVVKLSDEDAAWLWPGMPPAEVLQTILSFGPRLAAVTLGGDGAILATAAHTVTVRAPRVEVADTIGAGDTFMASLLASAVAHGAADYTAADLAAFGERAVAAAAITVSRPGADLPWASELA
jgi:fructokinase